MADTNTNEPTAEDEEALQAWLESDDGEWEQDKLREHEDWYRGDR